MSKKITWFEIYQDFQRRFPRLSKNAAYYQPNGFLSILVYFVDGTKIIYNYMEQRGRLITA